MKLKWIVGVCLILAGSGFAENSLLDPINEAGFGTVSLRVQSLSMYRDYEGVGNGYSTTLGWKLGYLSPEWSGLSGGLTLVHSDVLHTAGGRFGKNGEGLLFNGRVNELSEAWIQYRMEALGLSNTVFKVGRQVVNGEVFRQDEFRQNPRSLEAVTLTINDIENLSLLFGHADRMSNVWDSDSHALYSWRFRNIEDVFGASYSTRGVTWAEGVWTGLEGCEVALYDAYAHDIVNLFGARVKCSLTDSTTLNGYYRHESDVGRGADQDADMFSATVQQKIGDVLVEPGFMAVGGDGLMFNELTTGINHPLGLTMMIYPSMYNGGAKTCFLKATTKIDKTVLYMLYNYTWQDKGSFDDAQELNVIVKQPITDRLTVALKGAVGYRDGKSGGNDTVGSDVRMSVTYNF